MDVFGQLLMERLIRERRYFHDRLDPLYVVVHDHGLSYSVDDRLHELDQLLHLFFEPGSPYDNAISDVRPYYRRSDHLHLVSLLKHTAHQLCLITRWQRRRQQQHLRMCRY
jgi:hypothetical protein